MCYHFGFRRLGPHRFFFWRTCSWYVIWKHSPSTDFLLGMLPGVFFLVIFPPLLGFVGLHWVSSLVRVFSLSRLIVVVLDFGAFALDSTSLNCPYCVRLLINFRFFILFHVFRVSGFHLFMPWRLYVESNISFHVYSKTVSSCPVFCIRETLFHVIFCCLPFWADSYMRPFSSHFSRFYFSVLRIARWVIFPFHRAFSRLRVASLRCVVQSMSRLFSSK